MKKLLFMVMALFAVCSLLYAAEYTYKEAPKHIGEEATICAKVFDSVDAGSFIVVGLGAAMSDPSVMGLQFGKGDLKKFDKDLYKGKNVCVTGKLISNPVGTASMEIKDPSQIVVK